MSPNSPSQNIQFSDLNLGESIIRVLTELGYETPSPIQAASIPEFMAGRDILGQAQTGTGKTAAFALPILARLNLKNHSPQALVLAPTRELAIQVSEAFQRYASYMPGFQVLPIYGGQSYGPQLNALRRGVHVVVGTPGRVIDHLEKGTLDLSGISTLVLDEADEMLRMGFIDEVETILQQTPDSRQTALFSATMPAVIKRMTKTYLRNPAEVTIAAKTGTADNIRQRFWLVSGLHKLDALTRILEVEPFDGMIIFARTKLGTEELASKLRARGFSAAAINGDMAQVQRERTIEQLKREEIDILVATDVAARGLDVERISHVVNYDVPHDPESYTHRIGRTGRAGRSGEAILFITPREKGMLRVIERATRYKVEPLTLPTIAAVNEVRVTRFKEQIIQTLEEGGIEPFRALVEELEQEHNVPALEIAAALAKLARGDVPLLLDKNAREPEQGYGGDFDRNDRGGRSDRGGWEDRGDRPPREPRPRKERVHHEPEPGMASYRLEVGRIHNVKPGSIVGAIANEADISSKQMGRIEIYDDFTIIDLPDSLSKEQLGTLQKTRVAGQKLLIKREGDGSAGAAPSATDTSKVAAERSAPVRSSSAQASASASVPASAPVFGANSASASASTSASASVSAPAASTPAPVSASGHVAYRIEVGKVHSVKPAEIVQALSEAGGFEPRLVGRIDLFEEFSVVDLPQGLPPPVLNALQATRIAGVEVRVSAASTELVQVRNAKSGKHTPPKSSSKPGKPGAKGGKKPGKSDGYKKDKAGGKSFARKG